MKNAKIIRAFVAWLALCSQMQGAMALDENIFMRLASDGTVELSNMPAGDGYILLLRSKTGPGPDLANQGSAAPARISGSGTSQLMAHAAYYRELVDEVARNTKLDARLIHAVVAIESGYNPQAVSTKGAIGLMQLMPATALRYGVSNARDPRQNILGGATYLRDLLKLFDNDLSLALAAYNAGENAVLRSGRRIPNKRETIAYVPKILALYKQLQSLVI